MRREGYNANVVPQVNSYHLHLLNKNVPLQKITAAPTELTDFRRKGQMSSSQNVTKCVELERTGRN
jgi:hypothetical protein